MFQLVYTKTALGNLKKIEKKDAIRILTKIKENLQLENPLTRAKKIKGPFEDTYRFRIGNYRAIFQLDELGNIIICTILTIKHRKEVYDKI